MSRTSPPVPEPDTKDWTWSITRPCPDCGFEASTVPVDRIADDTLAVTDRLVSALDRPDVALRPAPQTWSALEYVAHVRDVCTVFGERAQSMLDQDDPLFANWDQDVTALEQRYWEAEPRPLAEQTRAAAARAAAVFASVGPEDWDRPGRRSNGSTFTVATLGRYFLHDLHHHAWDVGV